MQVTLEVTKGADTGKRLVLEQPKSVIVGRKDDRRVVFQISDRRFSRYHFMFEAQPGECSLRDLGSTNGTYVNGRKVKQSRVKDGDVIHIGKNRFLEFLVKIEEPARALPESASPDAASAEQPPPEAALPEPALLNPASPEAALPEPALLDPASPEPALPEPAPLEVPSAEADSSEGGASGRGDTAGRVEKPKIDMDTLPIDALPTPVRSGKLCCEYCGSPAEETELTDLTDTRMITYACRKCRDERVDDDHPIPNYEVLEVVGRGSLGAVYKARRVSTDKLVALKLLPRKMSEDPLLIKVFLRQMRLTANLQHENIVPMIEMGKSGGQLWLAMEFVEGVNAAVLARQSGGKVPLSDAVDIICQVLSALDHSHGANLVHRDVKPPNILVSGQAGNYLARLSDFGLIKNVDEAGMSGITEEGEKRGTVPFMSPEQAIDSRSIKPASDIYAAGATLYWLLTGEFVYDFEALDPRGEVRDPFLIILEDPIIPIRERDPSIPEPAARVIAEALQRDPEDRTETAAEMARALRAAVP